MKHKLLIGIAGGVLALILAGGAVLASPSVERSIGMMAQATAVPTSPPDGAKRQPGQGVRQAKAQRLALMLGRATADVTGLAPKDVLAEVRSGKSLDQVAQAHGKTAADVIGAARAKLDSRLKQAVTNGRLTQARADAMLAQFDQSAPQVMSAQNLGQRIRQRAARQHPVAAGLVKATADVTGLTPKDVLAQLRAGKSLTQIAQTYGKTADDILAKARELGQQRLDKALDRAKDLVNQPDLGRGQRGSSANPAATPTP